MTNLWVSRGLVGYVHSFPLSLKQMGHFPGQRFSDFWLGMPSGQFDTHLLKNFWRKFCCAFVFDSVSDYEVISWLTLGGWGVGGKWQCLQQWTYVWGLGGKGPPVVPNPTVLSNLKSNITPLNEISWPFICSEKSQHKIAKYVLF